VTTPGWERRVEAVERLRSERLPIPEFGDEALRRLRRVLAIDAAFFATVDPATLLFTSARTEEPLGAAMPLFLENEFGHDDVNKFASLARSGHPVSSLDRATSHERAASPRYRDIMAGLGLGDEVRVALMAGGQCWGVLCLHREDSDLGFDEHEIDVLERTAPRIAEGLRRSLAIFAAVPVAAPHEGPGIVILDDDLSIVSINSQAERWLAEIGMSESATEASLPLSVYAAALELATRMPPEEPVETTTRLRTQGGTWLTVQASQLNGATGRQIAIVLERASPVQISSLVLSAQGLTAAQSRVAQLVLQGRSTRQIVAELRISRHTVQEHLGVVFEKFGIGSRRELVAKLLSGPHS
jgi:DNA-binding CsgD family transcriptional regulator